MRFVQVEKSLLKYRTVHMKELYKVRIFCCQIAFKIKMLVGNYYTVIEASTYHDI